MTRRELPIILVRGFGGLSVEDEKQIAYQGFNDGTVYPQKRGENYVYEGLVLRFLKSDWRYADATNVVGYYGSEVVHRPDLASLLAHQPPEVARRFRAMDEQGCFAGAKVVIDPAMALHLLRDPEISRRSLWVFRYYDLNDRRFDEYGKALARLIEFIRLLLAPADGPAVKVNIIAHSMGGLLVRQTIQHTYPALGRDPADYINKVVTLGTPHQGIAFQVISNWIGSAQQDLEHFNPDFQADANNPVSYQHLGRHFPLGRFLTVVGTNYRTYGVRVASLANRLAALGGEYGLNYNRSDGLVKQRAAQIPGAPRTFVHKCHGGFDSLVTARESFEIATRFFFGNIRVRLRLVRAEIRRGKDRFGKSEFFFGVSVKPRQVDFELFHQSAEAENCYGPFSTVDLADPDPAFGWAGPGRLIWEGWLNTLAIERDPHRPVKDLVLRLDVYLGERDLFGIGFSDNVVFRKQYYLRALLPAKAGDPLTLATHTSEEFGDPAFRRDARRQDGGWEFDLSGTGLEAVLRAELDVVPEDGEPVPLG